VECLRIDIPHGLYIAGDELLLRLAAICEAGIVSHGTVIPPGACGKVIITNKLARVSAF
jgi:hypothetical protein